ncbi:MAG: endo-1,4-beta-xylanase [Candidatus Woesearchaeota archaeon]
MMKLLTNVFFILLLLICTTSCTNSDKKTFHNSYNDDLSSFDNRSLMNNVSVSPIRDFIIGGALNPALYYPEYKSCLDMVDNLFNLVVDEGRMNWKISEPVQGKVNFFAYLKSATWVKEHNKTMRNHNLFWTNPDEIPSWAKELSNQELRQAMSDRISYVASKGSDITSLDVINEMIVYDYFRTRLGNGIIKDIYAETKLALPLAKLYINENPYHVCTLKQCNISSKEEYKEFVIDKFLDFLDNLSDEGVIYDGIGLQAHFTDSAMISNKPFNYTNEDHIIIYDELITKIYEKTGKKVLITEFDFESNNETKRANFISDFYTMALNHPYTEGIIYWSWLTPVNKAIVDYDCKLNSAGQAYLNAISSVK